MYFRQKNGTSFIKFIKKKGKRLKKTKRDTKSSHFFVKMLKRCSIHPFTMYLLKNHNWLMITTLSWKTRLLAYMFCSVSLSLIM